MQQNFPGGLPVNSSPSSDEGTNSIRNGATQATGGSADLPKATESYYIPSPTSQLAEIGHHAQSQHLPSNLFPGAINTSIAPYHYPQVNSASSSSQGVWPTPPSTTCEEDVDSYSFHGSPASASCRAGPYSTHSAAASPGTWSAPEDQHFQMPTYHYPSYPQPQYGQQYFPQSSYDSHNYPRTDMNMDVMAQPELPAIVSGLAGSESQAAVAEREPEKPKQGCASATGKKVEEPYAQLIWRAFLSTPTHSMTLQQLYQWFRDNTEKGRNDNSDKGEKEEARGWMNSIRHNLSMNQAFVKRDRKSGLGDSVNESGDSKKPLSEWVLEDWAVNGVQSTTRYRSKPTSARPARPGSRPRPRSTAEGRVSSGRKGGVAASNSKKNAAKKAMINRNSLAPEFPGAGNNIGNLHDPMHTMGYDHRLGLQYALPTAPRSEHFTTPNPNHESMILATNPMQPTALPAPDPNHPFAFAPPMQHYNHNAQHMYPLEDGSGIYQGHHGALPIHGNQGLAATIPQDLSELFEDSEENRNRLAFPYWPDPNDPSANNQNQYPPQ
ncbi:uncharacterized protein GGS22DRAFT_196471 [Annulohypoxylon maeteangense]|uniref:uncharacterized protein n=1 Tax=Annulohypoxylon maeteangense TaxID=1927788 RepID=UPI0020088E18|nr:uncharacterized protein GGS22DRAFT_196471 [Annulohypoxylon maeteangense]KAI0881553.1 hypothetical protein GGS22DRAFT_196471 [Annulohypoxylon maeteangense]